MCRCAKATHFVNAGFDDYSNEVSKQELGQGDSVTYTSSLHVVQWTISANKRCGDKHFVMAISKSAKRTLDVAMNKK